MNDRVSGILHAAREERVFSAAGWSYGDTDGAWSSGVIGTLSWGGANAAEDSYWDLASVSKPIVAIAVMSLVESGQIALDDTIGGLLPAYGADKEAITVRQLLTHTSGLPGQVPLYHWNHDAEAMQEAIAELALVAEPGTAVRYSSQGYIILGQLVEAASGQSLDQLLEERVFQPAGMTETSFGLEHAKRVRAVATEDDPWRGRIVQGEVHDENAVVIGRAAGHAGLFSTLADMEKLARTLCAEGVGEKGRLLSSAGHRAMITPLTDHLGDRRSLGWVIAGTHAHGANAGDLIGPFGFGHTGFTGTSVWIDPEAGRYSVLLTNRVHPTRSGDGISRVRKLVNNVAFGAVPPRS